MTREATTRSCKPNTSHWYVPIVIARYNVCLIYSAVVHICNVACCLCVHCDGRWHCLHAAPCARGNKTKELSLCLNARMDGCGLVLNQTEGWKRLSLVTVIFSCAPVQPRVQLPVAAARRIWRCTGVMAEVGSTWRRSMGHEFQDSPRPAGLRAFVAHWGLCDCNVC